MTSSPSFVPIVHEPSSPRRHLLLLGRHASSSENFTLDDLPTSGGRMDIIARCIRAAFLLSDDIRRHTTMDIVLLGGANAPTTLHIDGATVRFLRPDERRLAGHLRHALGVILPEKTTPTTVAPGIQRTRVGLYDTLSSSWDHPVFVMDKHGTDVRSVELSEEATYVFGDHTGLTAEETEVLCSKGAVRMSLGPADIHAEDAIAILHNELDRRLI